MYVRCTFRVQRYDFYLKYARISTFFSKKQKIPSLRHHLPFWKRRYTPPSVQFCLFACFSQPKICALRGRGSGCWRNLFWAVSRLPPLKGVCTLVSNRVERPPFSMVLRYEDSNAVLHAPCFLGVSLHQNTEPSFYAKNSTF